MRWRQLELTRVRQDAASSTWTVRTHLTRIFARTGAADRMELALRLFASARGTSAA
jgi:hypothetical protein